MAKRKQRAEEEDRELTRKEVRIRARDRERNQRLYLGTGIAIGLALLVILTGIIMEFVVKPRSVLAKVGDDKIITQQFWKRTKLEKSQMENQLARMQDLEKQFGGQSFFTQQINQLQQTLSSPLSLATQVLNNMIDEKVVAQQAKARGITVTEKEVDQALRDEIAAGRGSVTEPQATATAEAAITATAEAKVTATAVSAAATKTAITATKTITSALPITAGKAITTSKVITAAKAITTTAKVTTTPAINASKAVTSTKAVTITKPVLPSKPVTATKALTTTKAVTTTKTVTPTQVITTAKAVTPTQAVTTTTVSTATKALTATDALTVAPTPLPSPTPQPIATRAILTDTGYTEGLSKLEENLKTVADMNLTEYREVIQARLLSDKLTKAIGDEKVPPTEEQVHARHILIRVITPTPAPAAGAPPTATPVPGAPPPTPAPAPRTEAQAMALAKQLRDQILKGEKFEDVAAQYSEDTASGQKGGDLGWFGHGQMVKTFDDAAFSLKVGDISQPITSTFGVHLIQVLEKDPKHPLEQQTLSQKRSQSYQDWLRERVTMAKIERPDDLVSKLPKDLQQPALPPQ